MNSDDISLWFGVRDCNKSFEDGSKLGFLTAVELPAITQGNKEWLVLMI